jgi:hypothetical protein
MPHARFIDCDLSRAVLSESELWSVRLTGSEYPSADIRGTNLERSGIFRHQALSRYPDLRYSDSTRWDDPDRRRIVIPVIRPMAPAPVTPAVSSEPKGGSRLGRLARRLVPRRGR